MGLITLDVIDPGEDVDAGPVAGNFATLQTLVNGALDGANISGAADLDANARVGIRKNSGGSTLERRRINLIEGSGVTITVADDAGNEEIDVTITSSGGVAGIPAGFIGPYGGSAAPSGWLLCDGSAVSRTTYADLFAVLSTTYGTGDGTTTFNVPDLRGRAPYGSSSLLARAESDGIAEGSRHAKHKHTVTDPGHVHGIVLRATSGTGGTTEPIGDLNFAASGTYNSNSATTGVTVGPAAGDGSGMIGDAPGFLGVQYIIKT